MHPSDEQLVTAYLDQNDQHAFSMLVRRHQERIFGYLLGMVHDKNLANDLFQETFLRVIKAMNKQRGVLHAAGALACLGDENCSQCYS